MATSKCGNCNSPIFETVLHTPNNSRFKLQFIQCAGCGAVVGTMDYYNIGERTDQIKTKIDKVLSDLEGKLQTLNNNNLAKINANVQTLGEMVKLNNEEIKKLTDK